MADAATNGFVETDIGLLPGDWKVRKLSECCTLATGGTPSRTVAEYWNGDIPWVKTGEVNYTIIFETEESISAIGLKNSAAKMYPAGTLLVAMYGQGVTRGRAGILGIDATINQACAAITVSDQVRIDFLFYALMAHYERIRELGHGANQRNLNLQILRGVEMPLPPFVEQRAIAGVLRTVQRAIEATEKVIAAVGQLKQSLMRHLFTYGPVPFQQADHVKLQETEIGEIPADWDVKPCDDLCDSISVGVVVRPSSHYVPEGVPAFRSFNVRADKLVPNNLVYFSHEVNDGKLVKSKLRAGDVLIVRTGYPGTSCVVPKEFDGANCIDLVFARPRKGVASSYLSRFFNSDLGRKQAVAQKTGLAQQHLNVGAVKRTLVPLPDGDVQEGIAEMLAAIDAKIACEEVKRDSTQELFDSLLHDLMTGQRRVHELGLDFAEGEAA